MFMMQIIGDEKSFKCWGREKKIRQLNIVRKVRVKSMLRLLMNVVTFKVIARDYLQLTTSNREKEIDLNSNNSRPMTSELLLLLLIRLSLLSQRIHFGNRNVMSKWICYIFLDILKQFCPKPLRRAARILVKTG